MEDTICLAEFDRKESHELAKRKFVLETVEAPSKVPKAAPNENASDGPTDGASADPAKPDHPPAPVGSEAIDSKPSARADAEVTSCTEAGSEVSTQRPAIAEPMLAAEGEAAAMRVDADTKTSDAAGDAETDIEVAAQAQRPVEVIEFLQAASEHIASLELSQKARLLDWPKVRSSINGLVILSPACSVRLALRQLRAAEYGFNCARYLKELMELIDSAADIRQEEFRCQKPECKMCNPPPPKPVAKPQQTAKSAAPKAAAKKSKAGSKAPAAARPSMPPAMPTTPPTVVPLMPPAASATRAGPPLCLKEFKKALSTYYRQNSAESARIRDIRKADGMAALAQQEFDDCLEYMQDQNMLMVSKGQVYCV